MNTLLIPLTVDHTDVKWNLIDLFRLRFATLWKNLKDLGLGELHGSFAREKNGCYRGGFVLPNEYRLKGLYVDFRHFYLQKAPVNTQSFANYLASVTKSDDYRRFVKEEKAKFRSRFVENGWFRFKGASFTTEQVLDIWFNAELFHCEPAKIETMKRWAEVLAEDTAKSMLFMAVYDSITVIRNLHWSVSELSEKNMYLKMPNKAVQRSA